MKKIRDQLKKTSRESKPYALWHWNLSLEKESLLKQFDWFVLSGFGGIIIRPSREMEPAYLSDEFFNLFQTILEKGAQKDLSIRLSDDFSLPWNGLLENQLSQNPELRAKLLRLIENRLVSGGEETLIHMIDSERSIIVALKETNGILDPATAMLLEPTGLNSENNYFKWCVPEGMWRILVFVKDFIRDPENRFLVNPFIQKAADTYIQNVLESFRERFSGFMPHTFEGFIIELPNILPIKNAIPWYDDLVVKFRNKSKKNIIKLLPSLYCDNYPGAQKNRQQIYSFFEDSLYEHFVLPIEEWSKKNRISQWPLYPEKADSRSPDVFFNCRIPPANDLTATGFQNNNGVDENYALLRMMADANANQYRRQTITVLGRNTTFSGSTLQSLKSDVDRIFLAGESRIIIDGFYVAIDQRSYCKAPPAPGLYSPEGNLFKDLCNYIACSNEFFKTIHWNRQIAVLIPSSEICASYNPGAECGMSTTVLERLKKTLCALERNGFSYDFVTEHLLSECSIRTNGEFGTTTRLRKGNYQALIVPYSPDISRNILLFIEKLIQKEGSVFFIEESPEGTIEDGSSSSIASRFEKILSEKHKKTGILSLDAVDDILEAITPTIAIIQNGKSGSDIATAYGQKDGYDVFLFHNNSDTKDQSLLANLPDNKHFSIIDREHGVLQKITPETKKDGAAQFKFALPPKASVLLIGLPTAIPTNEKEPSAPSLSNSFVVSDRSYRILLKDQWTIEPLSMNVLPLSAWNLRIGLSRESGGFSHFYESGFQVKNLPNTCFLVMSKSGLSSGFNGCTGSDTPVEVTINGIKVENFFPTFENITDRDQTAFSSDFSVLNALTATSLVYPMKEYLLRGSNRISLRTTGLAANPGALYYPPLLFGDFLVTKGLNGGAIDSLTEVITQNSWIKSGFPYLCGKCVYHQSFELPDGFKKIVLCFPNVSGAIEVRLNGKMLGVHKWQPMRMDITSICEQKRNDLSVSVVNNIDALLRMNGRPSGITGDVYLDVY